MTTTTINRSCVVAIPFCVLRFLRFMVEICPTRQHRNLQPPNNRADRSRHPPCRCRTRCNSECQWRHGEDDGVKTGPRHDAPMSGFHARSPSLKNCWLCGYRTPSMPESPTHKGSEPSVLSPIPQCPRGHRASTVFSGVRGSTAIDARQRLWLRVRSLGVHPSRRISCQVFMPNWSGPWLAIRTRYGASFAVVEREVRAWDAAHDTTDVVDSWGAIRADLSVHGALVLTLESLADRYSALVAMMLPAIHDALAPSCEDREAVGYPEDGGNGQVHTRRPRLLDDAHGLMPIHNEPCQRADGERH